jgi:hypothetical protein
MSKKDWFDVNHRFTVTNADELWEYLAAASYLLSEELEYEFEQSLKTQPKLAVDMLESIGVKCIAETR